MFYKVEKITDAILDDNGADIMVDEAGTRAMKKEIERRASTDLSEKGVSPAAAKAGGRGAAAIFDVAQGEYTKDRVKEEVSQNLETGGRREKTY